jgi:hypothetical protein
MHFMNVLVEELCVEQSMNIIKTDFLQPIVSAELEHEDCKTGNDFCIVRHVVIHDSVDQKEGELCENQSHNELVHKTIEKDLEWKEL